MTLDKNLPLNQTLDAASSKKKIRLLPYTYRFQLKKERKLLKHFQRKQTNAPIKYKPINTNFSISLQYFWAHWWRINRSDCLRGGLRKSKRKREKQMSSFSLTFFRTNIYVRCINPFSVFLN